MSCVESSGGLGVTVQQTSENGCDRFGGNDGRAKASVTGGEAPFTYLWDDPAQQKADSAVGLATGTYSVLVTDKNGCTGTGAVSIEDKIKLDIVIDAINSCNSCEDGVVTVSVAGSGTPPYTYRWNDANEQTTATATGLQAGSYVVLVTDSEGCFNSDTVWFCICGVKDIVDLSSSINVYPNPVADGMLIIESGMELKGNHVINVYNMAGKMVFSEIVELSGVRRTALTLGELENGLYLIEMNSKNTRAISRFQVLK